MAGGSASIWITRQHLDIKVVPQNVAHRLHDVEDQLKLALDASGLTTWEFDIAGGREGLAGAITADLIGGQRWSSSGLFDEIHADDHDMVLRRFQDALASGRIEFEVRDVPGDPGAERWLEAIGTAYRSHDGSAVRFAGTLADATSRRASLHERALLERQLPIPNASTPGALLAASLTTSTTCSRSSVAGPRSLPRPHARASR